MILHNNTQQQINRIKLRCNATLELRDFIGWIILFFTISTGTTSAQASFSDRVLVIVNEDVITQSEYDYRLKLIRDDIQARGELSDIPQEVYRQLLESMVSDRLQIQEAKRRGLEISDEELNLAIRRYAAQQNLDDQQFRLSLLQRGEDLTSFRENVRNTLLISRLTEYYAVSRVTVPDYEIDGFIAQNRLDDGGAEYNISHLLIKNPEQNRALAEQVLQEIKGGLSFQKAILTYSEATDAQDGGLIGWRRASQLPEIFAQAVKSLKVGELSEIVESPNGLHILKLIDRKGDVAEIEQSMVQHILITAKTEVARTQAAKKLFEIRQRIVDGESFSDLARIFSDDSVSAANGGDLGWVSPGEMVPQFEEMFKQMQIGEVSQPFSTQYGVHVLQVTDRRTKNITDQLIRRRADNILRRQRAEREFQQWVRQLREQAYIEYVSQPA